MEPEEDSNVELGEDFEAETEEGFRVATEEADRTVELPQKDCLTVLDLASPAEPVIEAPPRSRSANSSNQR